MREVLIISADGVLSEALKLKLECAGFVVSRSGSLEESFLEVGRREPFMAIVDGECIPEPLWQARNFLNWLHHRSPVVLLSDQHCDELKSVCDDCLPRHSGKDELLTCIKSLSVP